MTKKTTYPLWSEPGIPQEVKNKRRLNQLAFDVHRLTLLVKDLTEALLLHARTDVAPDSAIPSLKKLAKSARMEVMNTHHNVRIRKETP